MIYKIDSADQLYQFYEMVGEGSFSKVYRAKFLPTGQIMAVKVSIIVTRVSLIDPKIIRKPILNRFDQIRGTSFVQFRPSKYR